MSIIAVSGLPPKWNKKTVVAKLVKTIGGKFEVFHIISSKKRNFRRKCYLRLSEKLDPQLVVENINKQMFGNVKLRALVPDYIPDLLKNIKPGRIPMERHRTKPVQEESTPGEIIYFAHTEIFTELQSRYTGLCDISQKTDHELLRNIARILVDRLKEIMIASPEIDTCFKLTKSYRKKHPHFVDFQLILSTLHQIEDAQGKPRTQLNKEEFSVTGVQPYVIDNIPYKKVNDVCRTYTKVLSKTLTEHTRSLNTDFDAEPDSNEAAVKRVRSELKKMATYFPIIIRQVIASNFAPEKSSYRHIRVYGDPCLPPKEATLDYLKRCRAIKVYRSDRMFNLVRCRVPLENVRALGGMDGAIVGGATMHVRSADLQIYRTPDSMKREMLSFLSEDEDILQDAMDDVDLEDTKEWEEEW